MKQDICIASDHIEVPTGEAKAASKGVLRVSALGSCVAVAMYDPTAGVGGLAHVMLPGVSPDERSSQDTKYAESGIQELTRMATALGVQPERLVACITGGGNVLERDDDTICEANIRSVSRALEESGIALVASEVGGTRRRSASLDVGCGRVSCTVGDSGPMLLWEPGGKQAGDNIS